MTTTVEIPDTLLDQARKLAVREGVTVRELVARGLRRVVDEAAERAPFKLRRASFKGKGLRAALRDAPWAALRQFAFEGRGG